MRKKAREVGYNYDTVQLQYGCPGAPMKVGLPLGKILATPLVTLDGYRHPITVARPPRCGVSPPSAELPLVDLGGVALG